MYREVLANIIRKVRSLEFLRPATDRMPRIRRTSLRYRMLEIKRFSSPCVSYSSARDIHSLTQVQWLYVNPTTTYRRFRFAA